MTADRPRGQRYVLRRSRAKGPRCSTGGCRGGRGCGRGGRGCRPLSSGTRQAAEGGEELGAEVRGRGRRAAPSRLPEDTVVPGVPGRGDQPVLLVEELLEQGGRHLGTPPLAPAAEALGSAQRRPLGAASSARPAPSVSQSYDRH